mmetsp:Transcript_34912/g.85404  ORF Transcript_34912/g.85404 Transcript_34912/m.85404 type:complete len:195 (-) Transcript_34912:142-726(-)
MYSSALAFILVGTAILAGCSAAVPQPTVERKERAPLGKPTVIIEEVEDGPELPRSPEAPELNQTERHEADYLPLWLYAGRGANLWDTDGVYNKPDYKIHFGATTAYGVRRAVESKEVSGSTSPVWNQKLVINPEYHWADGNIVTHLIDNDPGKDDVVTPGEKVTIYQTGKWVYVKWCWNNCHIFYDYYYFLEKP